MALWRGQRRGRRAIKLLLVAIVALLLAAVFIANCQNFTVLGRSMEPSLIQGDRLRYIKFRAPEYGSLVIFRTEYELVVKRVAGLPGDVISTAPDGGLTRNGEKIDEPYALMDASGRGAMEGTLVEEGHIFVLGDNRGASIDSRDARIGQIPLESVAGYVRLILRDAGSADSTRY